MVWSRARENSSMSARPQDSKKSRLAKLVIALLLTELTYLGTSLLVSATGQLLYSTHCRKIRESARIVRSIVSTSANHIRAKAFTMVVSKVNLYIIDFVADSPIAAIYFPQRLPIFKCQLSDNSNSTKTSAVLFEIMMPELMFQTTKLLQMLIDCFMSIADSALHS